MAPTECPEDLKPLEEDDCDNNCTISDDGSGDNATEVISKRRAKVDVMVIQVATGDPEECEYYDDWWIFGEEDGSSGEEDDADDEEDPEFRRRKRRQAEGSGSGDGEDAGDAGDAGGGGNGTVADGEGGNSTKKEIDLSIFSKRCKPEKVWKG